MRTAAIACVIGSLLVGGCTSGETSPSTTIFASSSTADQIETTTSTPTAPDSSSTSTVSSQLPVEVEGQGWRLVLYPSEGESVAGPDYLVCYEVTGTTREATVALEVTLMSGDSQVATDRVDIDVGRGSAVADLSGAAPGEYDLVVSLILNGVAYDELTAQVGPISLEAAAPEGGC